MPVIVAVAIFATGEGQPGPVRVLAAERSYPPSLAGQWEFPGGKVDAGEDEVSAAVRECAEELGVVVHIEGRLGPDVRTAAGDPLHLWAATIVDGEPGAREHSALRWLSIDDVYDVPWIAADLPLVAAVAQRLRPRP